MLDSEVANVTNLAKIIGISRTRIYQKMEKRADYKRLVAIALAYLHLKQSAELFSKI
jgi:DNA-binding XRE family transcriptional regulator